MRKTIAIDMDGVLADIEAQIIKLYEQHTGERLTKQNLCGKAEADVLPTELFRKFIYSEGFFRTLPVMDGAIEAVAELSRNYEIYIVSAAMEFPLSLFEKHEWLAEHFPSISWRNIIFCGDKSIIKTDYMIDDHPKNLDFCQGKPLMFAAFHNHGMTNYNKFDNWKAIVSYFEQELVEVCEV